MGNAVVHFELIGPDPARLRAFYGELFGWEAPAGSPVVGRVSAPNEYSFIPPDAGAPPAAGGIGGGPGFDSHVVFYVGVEDVREALAQADRLGATVVMPPQRNKEGQVTVGHSPDRSDLPTQRWPSVLPPATSKRLRIGASHGRLAQARLNRLNETWCGRRRLWP
jgi:uncharacterized protein